MHKLPTTMSAVQLTGHGGLEMQALRHHIAVPTPKTNEVLIRVAAAGVNNTDINTRIAWYSKGESNSNDATWNGSALSFPRIQGADVCGEIVAVGESVDSRRIGERVLIEPCITALDGQPLQPAGYFGSDCDGGFAQYTVVAAQHAYAIQCDLTDIELASFPCSYSTAENMLTRAQVTQGDRVLITGASGGVGSAALQLAKVRGATVFAQTSACKAQQLLELGVDQIVERTSDLAAILGENSIDVVIDLVAGKQWPTLLQILKPGGRYAVSGAIGGAMVDLDVRTLYLKDLSFFGCTVLAPQVFSNLIKRIEEGKVKPLVAQTFALKEIDQAQQTFLEKNHVGKIVLTVDH